MTTQALDTTTKKKPSPTENFRRSIGRSLFTSEEALEAYVNRDVEPDPDAAPAEETPEPDPEPEAPSRPPMSLAELAAETQRRLDAQKGAPPKKDDEEEPETPAGDTKPEGEAATETVAAKTEKPAPEAKTETPETKPEPTKVKVVKKVSPPLADPPLGDAQPKADAKPEPEPEAKSLEQRLGFVPTDDERDYFEALDYADRTDPARKGVFDAEAKRVREIRDYVSRWETEHPGEEFNPDYDDTTRKTFQKLRQDKKPALSRSEVREIERKKLRDELDREVDERVAAKTQALDTKLRTIEELPKIQKLTDDTFKLVVSELPEEYREIVDKHGLDALAKSDPVIGVRVANMLKFGRDVFSEYLQVAKGLKAPDLGEVVDGRIVGGNEVHQWASSTIQSAGEHFRKNGGDDRIMDGKEFLPPHQYAQLMRKDARLAQSKYWTWNHEHTINVFGGIIQAHIAKEIETTQESLKKAGYQKGTTKDKAAAAAEATPSGEPPPASASPRMPAKPMGGSSQKPKRRSVLDSLMTATNAGT